jgi:bifunctional non-homologous end joining protein LigD
LIFESAARINGTAIIDAEVVWIGSNGVAEFDALHNRVNDQDAAAWAFDLLMLNGEDLRRKRYVERKAALRKLLRHDRGIQYVEHAEGHGDKMFAAVCHCGLEGIVSRNWMRRIAQDRRKAGSKSKTRRRQRPHALDGTFYARLRLVSG